MDERDRRNAWIAAFCAFILLVAYAELRQLDRGGFRIDEAHKISETHYLRLFARGNFSSPEWFRNVIDRSNPPAGKYYFGTAIVLTGLPLPQPPSLSATAYAGQIAATFGREVNARYAPYLVVCRCAALFATALTAALLVWFAMRVCGPLAALVAFLFFCSSDMIYAYGATAIFDPLLTLAGTAILSPVWLLWRNPPPWQRYAAAVIAGLLCGLAVAVRLSGGVVLIFCVVALAADALRRRSLPSLVAAMIVVTTAGVVAITLNPFYWACAAEAPGVAAAFRACEPLPLRIVHRIQQQLRDLQSITAGLDAAHRVTHSPVERLGYWGRVMFAGFDGFALWVCASAGLLVAALSKRLESDRHLVTLWAATIAGGTALSVPVRFGRYMFITLPPLALLAGVGVAGVVQLLWHVRLTRTLVRRSAA